MKIMETGSFTKTDTAKVDAVICPRKSLDVVEIQLDFDHFSIVPVFIFAVET